MTAPHDTRFLAFWRALNRQCAMRRQPDISLEEATARYAAVTARNIKGGSSMPAHARTPLVSAIQGTR